MKAKVLFLLPLITILFAGVLGLGEGIREWTGGVDSGNTFLHSSGNILRLPVWQMLGHMDEANIDTEEGGGFCLQPTEQGAPADCDAAAVTSHRLAHIPYSAPVFVDTCKVNIVSVQGYDAAGGSDDLYFQLIIYEPATNTIVADLGDPWNLTNSTDTCGGASNCAIAVGSYTWQVDGTVSGLTSDVDGATTNAVILIEIDAATNDQDVDADGMFSIVCTAFETV